MKEKLPYLLAHLRGEIVCPYCGSDDYATGPRVESEWSTSEHLVAYMCTHCCAEWYTVFFPARVRRIYRTPTPPKRRKA